MQGALDLEPVEKPRRRLISSVWEFGSDRGDDYFVGYRWYGTFPSALSDRLCELYAPRGSYVVDLFAGTGSTVISCARNGNPVAAVDSNPLACLITNCRYDLLRGAEPNWSLLERAIRQAVAQPNLLKAFCDEYPYSSKWFRDENLAQVLGLLQAISALAGTERNFGTLLIAASVRDIASVNAICTHHLVWKDRKALDVAEIVLRRMQVVKRQLSAPIRDPAPAMVLNKSAAASGLASQAADLVILHPPYLGVIHYHNIHRLALDLVHFSSRDVPEVSASFEYETVRSYDASTDRDDAYREKMQSVLEEAVRIVKPTGSIVLIQGDHRYKGRLRHPITYLTVELERMGMLLHERFIWLLNNNGGMHVERKGHYIDHNYVCVFKAK